MDIKGKQPSTWDDYEQGAHRGSVGSTGSRVHWDELERQRSRRSESSHLGESPAGDGPAGGLRRRSSMTMRLTALGDAGGVNSINNFARSWQRAAGFYEVAPVRQSFRISQEDGEPEDAAADVEATPHHQRGLLRGLFEEGGRRTSDNAVADDNDTVDETQHLLSSGTEQRLNQRRASFRDESIFAIEPSLASVFGGSYGTTYGSLSSRINESSMRHAGRLFTEQQLKGATQPEGGREPLLVKQVEENGQIVNVVVGQSTLYQTIFNSVNVLIGVGLLSLPLALKYSGWLIGVIFFTWAALTTQYTAKLLAKCLDVDSSLITFADLAYVSFGNKARIATSILFSLELVAACVALIILFADSLNALVSGMDLLTWKILCGFILIPLSFLPLRLLSFTSVLGVMCCFGIVVSVIIDGLIKTEQPGSLLHPAKQYLFPKNWTTVPLAFGLMMSPWGGHSVFPNIYRDMRHPFKYRRGLNITYIFTFVMDLGMACIGILMFGDGVLDEITNNIFLTAGYPEGLSVFMALCIAIIPLTKVPLNARPIISTVELLLGLDPRALATTSSSLVGMNGFNRGLLKFSIRIVVVIVFVFIAIVFPSFDRIMTLFGAVACFTICIILPLGFHLKLFSKEMPRTERLLNWVLIVVSSIMALVSTVFAILPKDLLGAD